MSYCRGRKTLLLYATLSSLRVPTVALDAEAQDWRKQAAKRGKIVRPEEYSESRHTAIHEPPLMVRRGGTPGQDAPVLWK